MTTGRTDKGQFAKGHSGNPNGRPPNCRALTAILETKGNATRQDIDGKNRAGKQIVGRAVWDLATTGRTQLQDGEEKRTLKVDGRTWFEIVKWIYAQVDGPPRGELDLTSDGERIATQFVIKGADPEKL